MVEIIKRLGRSKSPCTGEISVPKDVEALQGLYRRVKEMTNSGCPPEVIQTALGAIVTAEEKLRHQSPALRLYDTLYKL